MADRSNRNRRERLKYGICLNEECEKCKTKEIIQVPIRRDFVCPVCGKELRECPPPKKKNNGLLLGGLAALIVLAGIIAYFTLGSSEGDNKEVAIDSLQIEKPEPVVEKNSIKSDTVINKQQSSDVKVDGSKVIKTTVSVSETTITTKTTKTAGGKQNSTLNLSYGTYKGEIAGGYPNGMGRLTYTKERQINQYDTKKRVAKVGDYVIGEFVNGFLVQGKHYSSDGSLIESLIVGTAPDGKYESK